MSRVALTGHRYMDLGQQLFKEVYGHNLAEVRRLLAVPGININYRGTHGRTPLMNAVYVQNAPEILRLLLAYPGIDVNLQDNDGRTALIMATTSHTEAESYEPERSKNLECIRQLVAVPGIDLNHIDQQGQAALVNTIRFEKLEAFRHLLDAGADVNIINTSNEWSLTPLMQASTGPYMECLRILLAIPGIEINAINKHHKTALYLAVDYVQRLNVQELLKSPRIAVNIPAQGGISPILRASQRNADGIIRDLLNAGAIVPTPVPEPIQIQQHLMATEQRHIEQAEFEKVLGSHIENTTYFIPSQRHLAPLKANTDRAAWNATQRLFLAVHHQDVEEVRRLLRVPGIDVNFQNMEGQTALYFAMNIHGSIFGYKKRATKEILDMLLDAKGLNPNNPLHDELPLVIAIKHHDRYALQKLLNHKLIDVNATDKYGQTALMHVIETYNKHDPYIAEIKELFDMILAKEPDINAVDNQGRTALFLAAAGNKSILVDALLQVPDIDVNIRNRDGDSAMSYAAQVWGSSLRPMVRKFLNMGAIVRPDDPPVVQEESNTLIRETLNKMSTSRRNPLNPNIMEEIKTFVGGMMRRKHTRRVRKTLKTRRFHTRR